VDYIVHILILVAIYSLLVVSLDLALGHTGLVSVAHAAFYGLGAYTSSLLAVRFGVTFGVGILAGMLVAALASFLLSMPSLRLHEDYFMIASFGFQMIVFNIFNNWTELTHGPLGIPGIPPPRILGWKIDSPLEFLLFACFFASLAYFLIIRLTKSPFGRVLHAIREDEIFAQALGKNTLRFKMIAFAISAALAALAGSVYAYYVSFIDPTSFTIMESILIMSMVIIGGAGGPWGPLIGAAMLVMLPEELRFMGFSSSIAANLRQILYGSLLVIMVIFRPRGMAGRFGFGR